MSFTAASATALFQAIESHALKLGVFRSVNTHEPLNPPPESPACSIRLGPMRPEPGASGLNNTSGRITFLIGIYSSLRKNPAAMDAIDPGVLGAACVLLSEYNGAFTLGNVAGVRNIDVMAATGAPSYVTDLDGKPFRYYEITLPIVINDMFSQAP